jgi:hypothetical protein
MSLRNKFVAFALSLPLLLAPLAAVSAAAAAGGEISGTVTDPRGAVVVGANVTVYAEGGTQPVATAKTDAQGQYKIQNLPPGTYDVAVVANGFGEVRLAKQAVAEGKTTKADARLEVASVETSVTVTAAGPKANSDPTYQALRQQGQDFTGEYAQVTNLVLRRDAATFTLRSGELYFLPAVEGRVTGAVFIGEGEMSLTPPVKHEQRSLALFTGEPSITEQFTKLTLRFTDKTYAEVKASPQARLSTNGPQAQRARDIFRDNQALLRTRLRANMELRTLVDLYTPERPGFFVAFIGGKRFEKLVFQIDPLGIPEVSPEEVLLSSYGETDGGLWTAFHLSDEYKSGKGNSDEDHRIFDITHHEIDGAIKGTQLAATDTLTLRPLVPNSRVLPFDLFPTLRVGRVRDEQGRDLQFIQESKGRDADFALIWPEPLEVGRSYKVSVEYQGGEVLQDYGGGNFILSPSARTNWHPNNLGTQAGDRATFDMTFRYPKGKTLIGTGAPSAATTEDGGYAVSRWSSGQMELAVTGFNYGVFKKKEVLDKDTGYNIEFYGNEGLTNQLRQASNGEGPRGRTPPQTFIEGSKLSAADGLISTTGMADSMIADAENSTRIYNAYFGKLPYTRVALTQQPAPNFGQAWPTLVYMPYTAFLDSTQRMLLTDNIMAATNDFYEYVGPHEVAHQWWGHIVGWKSYRDQWMSEGFAEFSASLWVQAVKGNDKFVDFWETQRRRIVESRPQTRDIKPYTVGPVTQGYRLNSAKTGGVAQFMIYPKGAYILYMIRMMMFDRKTGDQRFKEMMQDFVKTNYNRDVSTEDFKRAVEKHITPEMDLDENGRMDWFFNEWVYGTEMPSYRLEYSLDGNVLTGRVTQSGVSDGFAMLVPIYVDLGKGWVRLGAATIRGNSTTDLGQIRLPATPKRVAIAPYKDILALSVENQKK